MPSATARTRTRSKTAPAVVDEDGDVVDLPGLIEHTVTFERDGEVEEHRFNARPRMTYKRMADAVRARRSGESVDALALFEKMIRPALLDSDGTPAKWRPEIEDGTFVSPDGDELPVAKLADVQAFDAGSSRRRWLHLLDNDDDVEIELDEITTFYERLVEAAADRPTQKPSR